MLRPTAVAALMLAPGPRGGVVRSGCRRGSADPSDRDRASPRLERWRRQRHAQYLAPDASFTNLFGMVMYVAGPFAQRHVEILAMFYKGTTKHHAIRRIRLVTPDVAIGHRQRRRRRKSDAGRDPGRQTAS